MRKNQSFKFFFGLIVWIVLSVQAINAQRRIDSCKYDSLKSLIKLTISWHNGLEWEKKISKISVIDLFGGMLVGRASDNYFDYKAPFIISPDAYAEYRNYYNLFRRASNHKKTQHNSANFFFGRTEIIFPVKNQNFINLMLSQGWGAQRSLSKKLQVGYRVGFFEHFYFDKLPNGGFNYVKFEPIGEFSISYIF